MSEESTTLLEEFCKRQMSIALVFIISLLFLLIQLPYLVLAEPGSGLYTVSVMNLFGLVIFTSGSGYLLYRCRELLV